jgi:hypothetical protein
MDKGRLILDAYDAYRSGVDETGFELMVVIRNLEEYLGGQQGSVVVVNVDGPDTPYRSTVAQRFKMADGMVRGMLAIDFGDRERLYMAVSAKRQDRLTLFTFGDCVRPFHISSESDMRAFLYDVYADLLRLAREKGTQVLKEKGPPKND